MRDTRFAGVYLFHDREGTPNGIVSDMESVLQKQIPGVQYLRPFLPHESSAATAAQSYHWLERSFLPFLTQNSLIIGVGLGGLLAARLQESFPLKNMSVFAINSPLFEDEIGVTSYQKRISLYSSLYKPIEGRCALWPQMATAYDVLWLQHGMDLAKYACCALIVAYMKQEDVLSTVREIGGNVPPFWSTAEKGLR